MNQEGLQKGRSKVFGKLRDLTMLCVVSPNIACPVILFLITSEINS